MSLDQYEIGAAFDELPAALVRTSAGASTEMLRRFRRGQLDASVFTAATRAAIWQGPSLDQPDALPTVIATRPLRLEVYAAACRPPSQLSSDIDAGEGGGGSGGGSGVRSGGAGAGSAVGSGVGDSGEPLGQSGGREQPESASNTHESRVTEHILYMGQAEAGAGEAVSVPPQIVSCEQMWRMPPLSRCSSPSPPSATGCATPRW